MNTAYKLNMIHRYTKGQMLWVPYGIGVDICGSYGSNAISVHT